MVVLKNIKKTSSDISADYYPEGHEPKGFMRISLADGSVIEHESSGGMAPTHVKNKLKRLMKLEKPPEEAFDLWY